MWQVKDEVVIASCGKIAREVYAVKDRPRNFYMQGSMGLALAMGLGLAYSRPDLNVIVISGDGAMLMSLGTSVLQYHLKLPNLTHYVLNNNAYASTGGQPTCFKALIMGVFKTQGIICNCESDAPRIPLKCANITRRFREAIRKQEVKIDSK